MERWNSYPEFERDMEGTLAKIGMTCVLDEEFQTKYDILGLSVALDLDFITKWSVSMAQMQHDRGYLFGLLQTATKK